jgi:hypothetical protein
MRPIPPPPSRQEFDEMVESLNSINREPRASVLIWHVYIEYLIDWIIRRKIKNPEEMINELNFYRKIMLVNSFDILPKQLIDNLYAINKIRNFFAHRIDVHSPAFKSEFRAVIKGLDWYKNEKYLQRFTTYLLFSHLATTVYHELYFAYHKL